MQARRTDIRQTALLARRLGPGLLRRRAVALLGLSVFVGAGIAAALGFFAANVQDAINEDVARFLGAPLVVRSAQPLALDEWVAPQSLRSARTASFTTGAVGPAAYHSVALKAVSGGYPAQGTLKVLRAVGVAQDLRGSPRAGGAWLDNRAMATLGAKLGDRIHIGHAEFVVDAQLLFEPDRLTQLQHTLPRVMIGVADLPLTGLNVNNGRGEFRYLFNGPADQLADLEAQLPARLHSDYEVLKPAAGSHPFSRMSQRANRFLGMVKVLVLILCGSAAAMLADAVVRGLAMPASVLRCLGTQRSVVARALLIVLGAVALAAGAAGCAAGWALQPLLGNLLEPHLYLGRARFEPLTAVGAVGVGLVIVVAFVQPRLKALGTVPAVAALRGEARWAKRGLVSLIPAAACTVALLWLYTDNPQLTAILALGVVVVVALAVLLGWGLTHAAGQLHRVTRGPLRVALRFIGRTRGRHIAPMATMAIAIMAFLITSLLRGSFLEVYHSQRLAHDGNYLFTGLPAASLDDLHSTLRERGASVAGLYPTVRARLASINGVAIDDALTRQSDTREETRSPVRLSWSERLPANNRLEQGQWPEPGSHSVSVDSEAMSDLGLELGDVLGFRVGARLLQARISSRRAFKGGGSAVTFWFMFAPDALESFDQRYMGGIQIDNDHRRLLAELSAKIPDLVITDLEQYLGRMRQTMEAITRVMNCLVALLLCAALVVVLASAVAGNDARRRQATLLRSLGVTRGGLYRLMLIEYTTLGLAAGAVGVLGAHLVAGLLFAYQFAMPYRADALSYTLVPLAAAGAFVALGYGAGRKALQLPPMRVLQQA